MIVTVKLDTSKLKFTPLRHKLSAPLLTRALYTSSEAIFVPELRRKIRANKSVVTGNLFRNLSTRVSVYERKSAAIDVGALGVMYGWYLEVGTKPGHTPPYKRIELWVKKKMQLRGRDLHNVTWRIMRSIRMRGTKAHPYLIVTWDRVKGRFVSDFNARVRAALAKP